MSIFKDLGTNDLEQAQDRLGGYQPLDTNIYQATVKALYAGKSPKGAMSVTLIADVGNGQEYRETLYITNRNGQNYFVQQGSNKKSPLPGFTVVNDLCLITTGKELSDLETEDKVINVYDPEHKKELPKSVPMIVEALGKPVALGIIKQVVNKNEKQGDEYVPTAETREENLIDKVFHPELKLTVNEARQQKTTPDFWDAWLKRNEGQTRDRRTIKDGAGATGGKPPQAGAKGAPAPARKSLFGK